MIKIEVTGNSIPEVADKLLAIGASLQGITTTMPAEVAEAAPPPKPKAPSTKSSTPVESTSTGQASAPSEQEAASPLAPASPTPPASASEDEELEVVDLPVDTPDLETVVKPLVLKVVDKRGKPFMEEILSSFGVVKASHIKPALLPKLVGLCHEALA
jgi:hypothetical protein